MRVLVTGLGGFTGQYLQAELEAHGHTVVGLQSDLTSAADVEHEIAEQAPDAIAHLAGIAFVGHDNADDFYQVNLLGTRHLLAAAAQVPELSAVLLASSANIYGNQAADKLAESLAPQPANDYAVSKLAMEHMARLWMDTLPIVIARPFNYTGVGQDENFVIPKIVSHFRQQAETIELGNLDVWREYGDVRTVAEIYRQLLEQPPTGQTLNVCTGETHSLREVIGYCEAMTGHTLEVQVNPRFVRQNEVKVLKGDNSLLRQTLGDWQPFSLQDTLKWMLQN